MARPKKTGLSLQEAEQVVPKNDFFRLLVHAERNPYLYAAGAVFVVLCFVAGIFVKAGAASADKQFSSAYATAVLEEDAAKRLEKLEALKDTGRWASEVAYVIGETAIQAGQYDKAKQAFEKVLAQYATSPFVARAADGLAFLKENSGDYEGALQGYQEVETKYPTDFIVRIKPYDIGRMQEKVGKLAEAAATYQKQVESFPDSSAAKNAQQALDKLKVSHPELFPEEKKEEAKAEGEAGGAAVPETAPAAGAPAVAPEAAPAAGAPVVAPEAAPAAGAPAPAGS